MKDVTVLGPGAVAKCRGRGVTGHERFLKGSWSDEGPGPAPITAPSPHKENDDRDCFYGLLYTVAQGKGR